MTGPPRRGRGPRTDLKIAVTCGEPAGIGPDLVVALAQLEWPVALEAIGDPDCLAQRAAALGLPLRLRAGGRGNGTIGCHAVKLAAAAQPGRLDPCNAPAVVACLDAAVAGCRTGEYAAIVTAPIHKAAINAAGIPFTGHTEYLSEATGAQPVMLLASDAVKVALVTTHLPLRAVPDAIDPTGVEYVVATLAEALRERFGLSRPRIAVCGLNPHAGEDGYLGREDAEVIAPAISRFTGRHDVEVRGPLPADTAFTPRVRERTDAFVAMYHDQGLAPLKALSFGDAVNVTLGLPIIRTSVDHGTALELAGSDTADSASLVAATRLAIRMADQPALTGAAATGA